MQLLTINNSAMDLTINRLKVLGEIEIANLDKKILEYKELNTPTILNKDIATIKIQINDLNALMQDLENTYAAKQREHTGIKANLEWAEKEYSKMEAKLESIENNILDTQAKLDVVTKKIKEHPTNLRVVTQNIDALKKSLALKEKEYDTYTKDLQLEKTKIERLVNETKTQLHANINTAESQLIVHPEGVRLMDSRSSIGVYDKSAPHGTQFTNFTVHMHGLTTLMTEFNSVIPNIAISLNIVNMFTDILTMLICLLIYYHH